MSRIVNAINGMALRGLARLQVARWQAEEGQTFAEYGLILGIIAVGLIVAAVALRDQIAAVFNNVTSGLNS
jgi:Flp pilus assembly pilin Flp